MTDTIVTTPSPEAATEAAPISPPVEEAPELTKEGFRRQLRRADAQHLRVACERTATVLQQKEVTAARQGLPPVIESVLRNYATPLSGAAPRKQVAENCNCSEKAVRNAVQILVKGKFLQGHREAIHITERGRMWINLHP